MVLIVENGNGLPDADSYLSIAEADTYWSKHGNPIAWTDTKATVDLIVSIQPSNGDTFTIDGKVYTFQTVLTDVDGNIKIGTDVEVTKKNIVDAINAFISNPEIAPSTTLHPTVESTGFTGTLVNVTALIGGEDGNLLAVSETFTNTTNVFSNDTLENGSNDKELALRFATQYLDSKYTLRWIGHPQDKDQALDWPRNGAVRNNGLHIDGDEIPQEVKDSTAEMALKSIGGDDIFDNDQTTSGNVQSFTNKVGPLTQSKTFVGGGQTQTKRYVKVDSLLKQVLNPRGEVRRS